MTPQVFVVDGALLDSYGGSILVTGDMILREEPPAHHSVIRHARGSRTSAIERTSPDGSA